MVGNQGVSSLLSTRSVRLFTIMFITFHVLMSVGYSLGPIFEGQDEIQHYTYIRYLLINRALPDRISGQNLESFEFQHAPLYYVIGALVRYALPDGDYDAVRQSTNPYVAIYFDRQGWLKSPLPGNYNKNIFLHQPGEDFPFIGSQTALAAHVLRLYSVFLSTLTVIFAGAVYRLLWPERPTYRLLALGITCAWPTFQYMSGLINNDNLVTLLATLCLFLCLRLLARGPSWRQAVLIGMVFGAALLAKHSGSLLAVPIAAAFLLSGRRAWHYGLVALGVTLAISGWWFVRNAILYDDFTGMRAQYVMVPALVPPGGHVPIESMADRWIQIYQMVWARFGLGNHIPVPTGMGIVYDLITGAGVIGLVIVIGNTLKSRGFTGAKRSRLQQLIVLAAFALALIAGLTAFIFTNQYGAQGRHLMLGVAAWASALSLGIHWWATKGTRVWLSLIVPALLGVLAILSLAVYHAAYLPSPLPPLIEYPRHFIYDNTVELLGVDQDALAARSRDTVEFTLYWKALKTTTHHFLVDIHTYDGRAIEVTSYSGTGNLLSTRWTSGQSWAEHYRIQITPGTSSHGPLSLVVFLVDIDSYPARMLPIIGPDNVPIMLPVVMHVVILPPQVTTSGVEGAP